MQEEPITECGSRPSGRSAFSSVSSVAPGRQTTCRPPSIRWTPFEPAQADQHDLAVVIVAPGGRAAGEPGIGRLEDHDVPRGDGRLQHAPLLDQAAGTHDGRHRAAAVAKAAGVAAGLALCGQDVATGPTIVPSSATSDAREPVGRSRGSVPSWGTATGDWSGIVIRAVLQLRRLADQRRMSARKRAALVFRLIDRTAVSALVKHFYQWVNR